MKPQYPYKTLKEVDGEYYIKVSEVEEIMQKTLDVKANFEKMRESIAIISNSLGDMKKQTQLLTEVN